MTRSRQQESLYVTPGGVSCPGHAGGPGRPLNSRPRLVTALREALDEDDTLERLRRVAIERMEAGDPAFWKMLLDRVWPAKAEITGDDGGPVTFAWLAQREGESD
jgi:hypothetical protein